MRRLISVIVPVAWLLAETATANAASSLQLTNSLPSSVKAGDTFVVTGAGCTVPSDPPPPAKPVTFQLKPNANAANFIGVDVVNGKPLTTTTLALVKGEVTGGATVQPDGTFTLSITIPGDSPPGNGYTLKVWCTTMTDTGASGPAANGPAATATAGPLSVTATPSSTTTAAPTTQTAPPTARPVAASPRFTG